MGTASSKLLPGGYTKGDVVYSTCELTAYSRKVRRLPKKFPAGTPCKVKGLFKGQLEVTIDDDDNYTIQVESEDITRNVVIPDLMPRLSDLISEEGEKRHNVMNSFMDPVQSDKPPLRREGGNQTAAVTDDKVNGHPENEPDEEEDESEISLSLTDSPESEETKAPEVTDAEDETSKSTKEHWLRSEFFQGRLEIPVAQTQSRTIQTMDELSVDGHPEDEPEERSEPQSSSDSDFLGGEPSEAAAEASKSTLEDWKRSAAFQDRQLEGLKIPVRTQTPFKLDLEIIPEGEEPEEVLRRRLMDSTNAVGIGAVATCGVAILGYFAYRLHRFWTAKRQPQETDASMV